MSDTRAPIPLPAAFDLRVPAAFLTGIGLLFLLAWNWYHAPRLLIFCLLHGAFVLACMAACRMPGARTAGGLLALLILGGLLAYFGQTYQSGVDEWRLLAVWALLGLPLCVVIQREAVWILWSIVSMSAIGFWLEQQQSGSFGYAEPVVPFLIAFGIALLILVLTLLPATKRFGLGTATRRVLAVLYLGIVCITVLGDSFDGDIPATYWAGLAFLLLGLGCSIAAKDAGASCATMVAIIGFAELTTMRRCESNDFLGELNGLLPAMFCAAVLTACSFSVATQSLKYPRALVLKILSVAIWFAVLPASVFLFFLLFDLHRYHALGIAGLASVAAGLKVKRLSPEHPLPTQLRLAMIFLGFLMITLEAIAQMGSFAPWLLAAVAFALGFVCPYHWVRCVFAMAAAGWLGQAHTAGDDLTIWLNDAIQYWECWHMLALAWIVLTFAGWYRTGGNDDFAARRHSLWLGIGIFLACAIGTLASTAVFANSDLLYPLASLLRDFVSVELREGMLTTPLMHLASAGFAGFGVAWLASQPRWRRDYRALAGGLALAGIAVVNVNFGVIALVLIVAVGSGNKCLKLVAGIQTAWVLWAFYFEVALPFHVKAGTLLLIGSYYLSLHWRMRTGHRASPVDHQASAGPGLRPMAVAALLALVPIGIGIWQKQAILLYGRTIFLPIEARDPRSLMQGDYMAVNFAVPLGDEARPDTGTASPTIALTLDERGVPSTARWTGSSSEIRPSEQRIRLNWRGGRFVIGTNAWFFQEGQARRWESVAFGEFRVLPDGDIMLVGLRDAQLAPL